MPHSIIDVEARLKPFPYPYQTLSWGGGLHSTRQMQTEHRSPNKQFYQQNNIVFLNEKAPAQKELLTRTCVLFSVVAPIGGIT